MDSTAKNLSATVAGLAALILIGAAIWFGLDIGSTPTAPLTGEVTPVGTVVDRSMIVHVAGAVVRPGVVSLPDGARVVDAIVAAGGAQLDADLDNVDLARTVKDGSTVLIPAFGSGPQPASAADRFDLNGADAAAYETLPGIGPVLAQRIVAYRDEHGPFESLEDLLDVPGIGESKLSEIRVALNVP